MISHTAKCSSLTDQLFAVLFRKTAHFSATLAQRCCDTFNWEAAISFGLFLGIHLNIYFTKCNWILNGSAHRSWSTLKTNSWPLNREHFTGNNLTLISTQFTKCYRGLLGSSLFLSINNFSLQKVCIPGHWVHSGRPSADFQLRSWWPRGHLSVLCSSSGTLIWNEWVHQCFPYLLHWI